jgi:hypothetical protein
MLQFVLTAVNRGADGAIITIVVVEGAGVALLVVVGQFFL